MLRQTKPFAEKAFAELYERYSARLFTYCCRMTGDSDQAKDIFQETLMKFLNTAREGENIRNVSSYMFQIARNLCLNYLRDKKITVEIKEDDLKMEARNHYEEEELFGLILTALDLLDDIHKEAFILRKFQNMSFKEMSEICGISVEGVKKRVKTATNRILKTLAPYIKDLSNKG